MSADDVVGVFMGLESASNEYIAWLIAPYSTNFAIEIGQMLLIENGRNHIVARVMEYVPRGEFTSAMGEKWLNNIAVQGAIDEVGRDIKKSKVSYRVRVRVLGSLTPEGGFVPGLRRIPQITSKVRRPSRQEIGKIIQTAMKEQVNGVRIGSYGLDGGPKMITGSAGRRAGRRRPDQAGGNGAGARSGDPPGSTSPGAAFAPNVGAQAATRAGGGRLARAAPAPALKQAPAAARAAIVGVRRRRPHADCALAQKYLIGWYWTATQQYGGRGRIPHCEAREDAGRRSHRPPRWLGGARLR